MKKQNSKHATMKPTANDVLTAFNRTLTRLENGWHWPDGSKEDKVSDHTFDKLHDFGIRSNKVVEVPVFEAESDPTLAWVGGNGYPKDRTTEVSVVWKFLMRFPEKRKEPVSAYLVPITDWENRASTVTGCRFHAKDIPYLAAKTKTFGYEWPAPSQPQLNPAAQRELQKPFTRQELKLVADALNGIHRQLVMDDSLWGTYTASVDDTQTNTNLASDIGEAMAGDRLDLKWDVEFNELINKLKVLMASERRILLLGMVEFWNRRNDDNLESLFDRLLAELNQPSI